MSEKHTVILASASPRRRELLQQIGVDFDVLPVDIDESIHADESPQDYVQRIALEKASEGFRRQRDARPVLGSDTIVVADTHIMGKPKDKQDAIAMLTRLSAGEHRVLSAVAMVNGTKSRCRTSVSRVFFKALSPAEIQAYWETGEPVDKAGAYGIQGMAAQFIERLDGSYSGVMGLPLFETAQLLNEFGIATIGHE